LDAPARYTKQHIAEQTGRVISQQLFIQTDGSLTYAAAISSAAQSLNIEG
jgi:hypothetical protein